MGKFHRVASVEDIKKGEVKSFVLDNEVIAVCNTDDGFYAFKDQCSHQELPLSDGELEGNVIMCAYHGAKFDVRTGEPLCLPAFEPIETYEVRIENGEIFVRID